MGSMVRLPAPSGAVNRGEKANAPSTTSTKFLSSRRMRRLVCAISKFWSASGSAFEARPVRLVGGEGVEGDQAPGHVVRAFVGRK